MSRLAVLAIALAAAGCGPPPVYDVDVNACPVVMAVEPVGPDASERDRALLEAEWPPVVAIEDPAALRVTPTARRPRPTAPPPRWDRRPRGVCLARGEPPLVILRVADAGGPPRLERLGACRLTAPGR